MKPWKMILVLFLYSLIYFAIIHAGTVAFGASSIALGIYTITVAVGVLSQLLFMAAIDD